MKPIYFLLIAFFCFQQYTYSQSYDIQIEQKIAENTGNFSVNLDNEDWLGYSTEGIGDINGDGINDIAVSAIQDDDGGLDQGAVYILFLNNNGTVNSYQKISETQGNFSGVLDIDDVFGTSVTFLGDMNGDGLTEIGVGAEWDGDGGYRHGAVYILSLNSNGTVNSSMKISDTQGGFTGNLDTYDVFGSDVELLGDLNGDGNQDIAVGSRRHSNDNQDRGAVWILFLNPDFTVASHQKIGNSQGNFTAGLDPQDYFGGSVTNIGDLNNDGVIDLAVGAYRDDDGGSNTGAMYILFLNSNGTVGGYQKISETQGNFNEAFSGNDVGFGSSVDMCADINGDGLTEILVGAPGYKNSGQNKGAFYILNLNPNGTVDSFEKYTEGLHNFTGPLSNGGSFGSSVSYIGALQKPHAIVVGDYFDNAGGIQKGSAWVLQLEGFLQDVAANFNAVSTICNSRTINVDYTISNVGDGVIPAGTPIAFYADNNLVGTTSTQNNIPWGGTETGSISLNIPAGIPQNFNLSIVVDDDGTGNGTIMEADENNNTDSLAVQLISAEIMGPLKDLYACDDISADGFAFFDLTINSALAIGNQTNVTISYHLSQADANMDVGAIANPSNFQNTASPQEIFIRIESTIDTTCHKSGSFFLRVINSLLASDPPPLSVCDDFTNDGTAVFDLTTLIPDIVFDPQKVAVSFHENPNNATSGINPIPNPTAYQNLSNPQTLYIRVESIFLDSCFATVAVELLVKSIDPVTSLGNIQNCEEGFDTAFFDLTQVENELEPGQTIAGYYLSAKDAENRINAIDNPAHYQSIENPQPIYVRIDEQNQDCARFGTFELSVRECPPVIPEGFSPNGDGINDTFEISGLYDIFQNFELTIFSRYGNVVYEANNNIPEWDGTSNHGIGGHGNQLPTATYFYVLDLNEPEYEVMTGWVYLMR